MNFYFVFEISILEVYFSQLNSKNINVTNKYFNVFLKNKQLSLISIYNLKQQVHKSGWNIKVVSAICVISPSIW